MKKSLHRFIKLCPKALKWQKNTVRFKVRCGAIVFMKKAVVKPINIPKTNMDGSIRILMMLYKNFYSKTLLKP